MSSLTRWVLAHKRTVVVGWLVLTIAGVMAAGPATATGDTSAAVELLDVVEVAEVPSEHVAEDVGRPDSPSLFLTRASGVSASRSRQRAAAWRA
jgi:hypothetical protein